MSLVPYGAGELALGGGAAPMLLTVAPYAAELAGQMYKDTKWAAKKIAKFGQKAYRKKKYNKKRRIDGPEKVGDPIGKHETNRALVRTSSVVLRNTRTLYSGDLIDIVRATDHEIDERHRDIINLKGVKLCLEVKNTQDRPMYFNFAIVVPKYDQSLNIVPTNDFFRNNQNGRGTDFSTGLSSLEMHCLPINTDTYTILWHKRCMLGPDGGANFNSAGPPNYMILSKWISVNRQIRFEANNPVNGRIQYVFWGDLMESAPADPAVTNAISLSEHHVAYYRNVI